MAEDSGGGFIGGYMAGGQYQSQQQAAGDQHQLAMQDLASGKLKLQQTQQLLDAQTAAMMELNQKKGSPPTGAGDPAMEGIAAQSHKASEMAFAAGDVYMRHGLIEQGSQFMERGAKLAESGAALETHQAEQQERMWGHIGSVLEPIHDNSPTASKDWDAARMTFPQMFPEEAKHPEVQKFLKMSYGQLQQQGGVDLLKRASQTAQQQAALAKTKAETKKEAASARYADAGVVERQALAREHDARATAIGKTGGKPPPAAEVNNAKSLIEADYPDADPKGYQLYASEIAERAGKLTAAGLDKDAAYKQAYAEVNDSGKLKNLPAKASAKEEKAKVARADLADDIDDLINDMKENPGASGLKGKIGRAEEFYHTTTGQGDQSTPLTGIVAKAQMIQTKLPKALTGSARSAKDERELTSALADITRLGTNDPLYIQKLEVIRDRFRAADGKETISGKGDKSAPIPFASEAELQVAIKSKKVGKGTKVIVGGVTGTLQ